MMGEVVFQLHIATPNYAILYKARQETSVPRTSFSAGVLQISYFGFVVATNKMATDHKTHELGKHSSNDHNCQTWFTSLHRLWRKCK